MTKTAPITLAAIATDGAHFGVSAGSAAAAVRLVG